MMQNMLVGVWVGICTYGWFDLMVEKLSKPKVTVSVSKRKSKRRLAGVRNMDAQNYNYFIE